MRDEDLYDGIPSETKIIEACRTLISKVQVAQHNGKKVSKESLEAVDVLQTLINANNHPMGGWAIFRP